LDRKIYYLKIISAIYLTLSSKDSKDELVLVAILTVNIDPNSFKEAIESSNKDN